MEALVRALASHAEHLADRLPRQASFTCDHHGLVERPLSGTDPDLRNRDPSKSGIIYRGQRVRTLSTIGVLNLVKHLLGCPHHLLPLQELLACRHGMKDEIVIIDTDFDETARSCGPNDDDISVEVMDSHRVAQCVIDILA